VRDLDEIRFEAQLAQNTKAARCRALLLVDEENRAELERFAEARKLDTGDGIDGWIERYTQALAIYNELIIAHNGAPLQSPEPPTRPQPVTETL
jgi:hypothetical protein